VTDAVGRTLAGGLLVGLLIACGAPSSTPVEPASSTPPVAEAAVVPSTLRGTVSSSLELPPDLVGDLHVLLFAEEQPGAAPPVAAQVDRGVRFSELTEGRPYVLAGVPPRAEPYRLVAIFDSDRNGMSGGPNPGDLMSNLEYFWLADAPAGELAVDLDEVAVDCAGSPCSPAIDP